jgi:hypothetical protein
MVNTQRGCHGLKLKDGKYGYVACGTAWLLVGVWKLKGIRGGVGDGYKMKDTLCVQVKVTPNILLACLETGKWRKGFVDK